MSTRDRFPRPEGAVQARFAALFQSFSQPSFVQPSPARAGPGEVAFLLGRLKPGRGARLICCDRSVMAYGWGLTAEGCAISVSGIAGDDDRFDGAIWSLDELGHPPGADLMTRLADMLLPGSRLVIDAGQAVLVSGWRHFPSIAALTPLGVARSPDNRRLYTWLREA